MRAKTARVLSAVAQMQRPFVRLLGAPALHPCAGAPVELLAERPDPHAARLRHAEHYAQFLARCGDRVEARSANAMIEPDLQNCLVAWQTLVEADLPASIEKMASPLGRFFDFRGRLDEGITLLQPVVHLFDTARARQARPYGHLQWNLANLLFRKAGFAEAESGTPGLACVCFGACERSTFPWPPLHR
jgi:hypothetical protein